MKSLKTEAIINNWEVVFLKISICQMNIAFENKEQNLKTIEKFIIKAKENNAEVVFFPEMSLTGFSMNIKETAEKDFSNIDKIKSLAVKNQICVGFGWVESAKEKAKNCYSVIDKNGKEICRYVKIHPFSYSEENKYFYGGENIRIFEINGLKFSSFICYDLRFPEIFQAASKSASVIVVAANWPKERQAHWNCLLRARAVENQAYIIGVNCFGNQQKTYYSGNSCVYNPNGDEICSVEEKEDLAVFEIFDDTFKYRKNFPVKNDRQIELYKKLL